MPIHTAPQPNAIAEHDAWRDERRAAVTAPLGNLALVETRWLPEETPATVDEAAAGIAAEQPSGVTVTTLRRTHLDTGQNEVGIRRWDANAPAIRAFDGIEVFPYDPAWVQTARFTPVDGSRTVPFEHIRDNGGSRELVVPGDIVFTRDGVEYTMSAFDDGGTLLLVFGDATNGRDDESGTYGAGRFLFVQRTDDGGFGTAGEVVLDFNRAFVPPCGFSVQYNCPMPPPQNRFTGDVLAGERIVRLREGFDLYAV
ncbi:DUF1684 domain-containing protein [Plantibacter sp. VKM Ac-2885]|uniref:DUF1684 domain-containing protein n=1 Tax=Plantibacter sp. VKM Ac-2885 TaxID=2783828 RepID=UPI00188D7B9A|nr:DUF1684 domain-containing protein [Plantibacter sp. VKM Ac-2885]MBF4513210.1 DUF1684 domain-containing protein [Plantibacter sp. VKM Ac-2885]